MVTRLEMKVKKAGGADALVAVQSDLAPPEKGEIQVRIEAAGVGYADIVIRRGLYSEEKPPVTPGYDFVGEIEAIGTEVDGFAIGDRVAGITVSGSYASHRNVAASLVVTVSKNVDPVRLVAGVLNGVTAWQMFHRVAHLQKNDWVLVHGAAGGVGTMLLELARISGVNAIGSASAKKQDVIRSLGATAVDYNKVNVANVATDISGGGVTAAFDHIGGKHFKQVTMQSLKKTGVGIVYGGYDVTRGGKVHPLALLDMLLRTRYPSFRLFSKSQGIVGYSVNAWRDERRNIYREDLSNICSMISDGKITPTIASTFPLSEAAEAHRAMEQRSVVGKIVLIP